MSATKNAAIAQPESFKTTGDEKRPRKGRAISDDSWKAALAVTTEQNADLIKALAK